MGTEGAVGQRAGMGGVPGSGPKGSTPGQGGDSGGKSQKIQVAINLG